MIQFQSLCHKLMKMIFLLFFQEINTPIRPCNLYGSQENMIRKKVKKRLQQIQNDFPSIQQSLMTAQKNIRASQLADIKHWKHQIGSKDR
ncbi:MAG: hypothetical protein AB8C84_06470 [Oligoflexales bacterium]